MKGKREQTFDSFDTLGDFMRQNGSKVFDEKSEENTKDNLSKDNFEEIKTNKGENTYYAFGAKPSDDEGNSRIYVTNRDDESEVKESFLDNEDNNQGTETFYAFGAGSSDKELNKSYKESVESKIEYNAMVAEDNLIKEIEQAQEILDMASGIPSSENSDNTPVEAEDEIAEVSHVETEDNGIVSDEDKNERLKDAEHIAEEIKICDSSMQRAITADPYIDALYKAEVIREKLSQKTKDIIRETAPELFEMINPRDVELMILLDEKFKLAKIDKKPLKEKFALAKRKKIASDEVLAEYSRALKTQKEFMDKAREMNVPLEVAKIIFKADPIFIKEIRDGEEYAINTQKEDEERKENDENVVSEAADIPLEDVVQEEPLSEGERLEAEEDREAKNEALAQKELYKQASSLFRESIEKIASDSEKERLLNALSTFDQMIESITEKDDQDNVDRIYNAADYMVGLDENIKAQLNEKQVKIEEQEAAIEIASIVESIEKKVETGKEFKNLSYDEWVATLPSELKMTASMAFNPDRNQPFKDIKFFTDENSLHYVVYTESNGERQARKMYTTEDEFGVGGVTELVSPIIFEGLNEEKKENIEPIEEKIDDKESKEKSELERKLEIVRNAIDKCRNIAHTIHDEEKKEALLSLIRTLGSQVLMAYNDNAIHDEEKIRSINALTKKAILDIDEISGLTQKEEATEKTEEGLFESIGTRNTFENEQSISKREIPAYVVEKYEKYGIGIDVLKTVNGFEALTDGQKLLMLKNYESAILSKAKTESKSESDKDWNKQPVLGRVGLSIVTLGMAKTFREKRRQQELANKITRGDYLGFENRQAMLESLVEVAKESPDVYVNKQGELEICYVNENKFRDNAHAREILGEYNKAATEYAKIPFNWLDSANTFSKNDEKADSYYRKLSAVKGSSLEGKEKAKFADVRDGFEKARENYFNLIIEEIGDSPENRRYALRELNSLDERIRMNQMFNSDPNAEQALQDIQDEKIFNQTLSEFWSKKGKYMAYGAITRAVAAATITGIAAPIGLVVVRQSSLLRSKREVRDMMKLRRTAGTLSEQDLREDVVYNVDLEKSQIDLKALLAKAKDENDLKNIYHFEARLNEVNDKLKSGYKFERRTRKLGEFRDAKFFSDRVEQLVSRYELLKSTKGQEVEAEQIERKIAQTSTLMRELMNNNMLAFGKGESVKGDSASMINRLKFIQALALADTTISLEDEKIKEKMSHIVDERREKMDKISADNAKRHISRQIKYSVAFGAAGYAIGHLASEFFGAPHFEGSSDGLVHIEKGDNINEIITHNIKGLNHLSNNAKENVISNFLNRLRPEQLKEIGIANPQSLKVGETINLEAMQKYFDNTRINGRTLVENARIVTGDKPLSAQLTQFINDIYNDYKANLREPEDVGTAVHSHTSNADHSAAAVNKDSFVSTETSTNIKPEAANETVEAPSPKVEDLSNQVEHANVLDASEKNIQDDWQDYTIQERMHIADKLIPEYLEKKLGSENMSVFTESAKNMPSSALRLTDYSAGGGKAKMLEELQRTLEENGITPENGFEYKYNETLYDYVNKAYKLLVIREGIVAIK